jgi:hypothetical protein
VEKKRSKPSSFELVTRFSDCELIGSVVSSVMTSPATECLALGPSLSPALYTLPPAFCVDTSGSEGTPRLRCGVGLPRAVARSLTIEEERCLPGCCRRVVLGDVDRVEGCFVGVEARLVAAAAAAAEVVVRAVGSSSFTADAWCVGAVERNLIMRARARCCSSSSRNVRSASLSLVPCAALENWPAASSCSLMAATLLESCVSRDAVRAWECAFL